MSEVTVFGSRCRSLNILKPDRLSSKCRALETFDTQVRRTSYGNKKVHLYFMHCAFVRHFFKLYLSTMQVDIGYLKRVLWCFQLKKCDIIRANVAPE